MLAALVPTIIVVGGVLYYFWPRYDIKVVKKLQGENLYQIDLVRKIGPRTTDMRFRGQLSEISTPYDTWRSDPEGILASETLSGMLSEAVKGAKFTDTVTGEGSSDD